METPDIKWEELPFGYVPTDYNVRCTFKDGKWGEIRSQRLRIHTRSHRRNLCLHYGQESFEGLKAFRGKDGKVRVFRMERTHAVSYAVPKASRWNRCPKNCSARMVRQVVRLNGRFPYPLTEQARPFTFAPSRSAPARVGVKPADEYIVAMLVTPVGPLFQDRLKPCKGVISLSRV